MSTASIYGRILKSSTIYSIAVAAPSLTGLLLLRVYTGYLSPDNYAVVDLLDQTRILFSMLVGGRFAEGLFYFYANARDEQERTTTMGTAILGSILVGIALTLLGWACSPILSQLVFQTTRWTPFFHLSFVTLGLTIPVDTGFGWLRARDRAVSFVAGSLARLVIGIVSVCTLLVVFHMGIAGILWGNIITSAVMAAWLAVPFMVQTSFTFVWGVFLKIFRFAMPLGLIGVAQFVIHFGDRLLLKHYVPLGEIAIYAIAYKIGMTISLPQTAFNQYWGSQVYLVIRGEDAFARFARVNTYAMTALAFTGVGIVVFAPAVIRTFTTPAFWAAIPFVPGVVLAYLLRAQGDYLRSAFYLEGKPGLDARLNWIAAAFCLGAYLVLLPAFKLWGGIIATALTFALLIALAWYRARKLKPYYVETGRLIRVFVVATAISIAALLLQPGSRWISWGSGVLWALSFPVALYLSGFFNASEKEFLFSQLRRLRGTPLALSRSVE